MSGAKLVLASNGLILDLGLLDSCLVKIFQEGQYLSFLGRSSQLSSAQGEGSVESMEFFVMKRRVSSVMGFPALLERLSASSKTFAYLGIPYVS